MNQDKLDEIGNEIRTQDNRITADPLFCVFEKERIYGIDPDFTFDGFEWVDRDENESWEEGEISEEIANRRGYEKCYYVERDRFCNAHFTEKSANHFIKINRHNLTRPFTYVTSLWRCYEMIDIRNYLKSQGEVPK